MNKFDNYTKKEIEAICKESHSIREACERIGYAKNGGSFYTAFRNYVKENDIDISHFTGRRKSSTGNCKALSNYLVNPKRVNNQLLKTKLINNNVFERKCYCCGNDSWLGNPIPIELHHKDGNYLNNTLENLEFLCPNCHALTSNYCRAKTQNLNHISEEEYIEAIKNNENIRQTLISLNLVPNGDNYKTIETIMKKHNLTYIQKENIQAVCKECGLIIDSHNKTGMCAECYIKSLQMQSKCPSEQILKTLIYEKSFCEIGRMYNVSDNTVRKWCKRYGLPYRTKDIKGKCGGIYDG